MSGRRPRWVLDARGISWPILAWFLIVTGVASAVLFLVVTEWRDALEGTFTATTGWLILSLRWYQR